MKRLLVMKIAVTAVVLATLAACGTAGGKATATAPTGVNRPTTTSATTTTAAPTTTTTAAPTTTTEAPPVNSKLGEAFTYKNGLAVTVGQPSPYTPSHSQSGASPGDKYVVFTITVINKTATNYEPGSFRATVQSANVEGNSVFDSANGIGGSPTTLVLPGRESKFKLAFGVADPKDLVVQVTPGYSYKPAIFTS